MARLYVGLVIAAIVFTILAVVDCVLTERDAVRALPKPLWLLVVILLPVIGGLLWFVIGRGPARLAVRRRPPPDDDPDFSRRAHGPSAPPRPALEEHPRVIEEDLASHDADPEDEAEGRQR
jgi:hypothetical protein